MLPSCRVKGEHCPFLSLLWWLLTTEIRNKTCNTVKIKLLCFFSLKKINRSKVNFVVDCLDMGRQETKIWNFLTNSSVIMKVKLNKKRGFRSKVSGKSKIMMGID